MPKTTVGDVSKTKQYIPQVSSTPGMSPAIACYYRPIENRNIHEGRIVDPSYYESDISNDRSPISVLIVFSKSTNQSFLVLSSTSIAKWRCKPIPMAISSFLSWSNINSSLLLLLNLDKSSESHTMAKPYTSMNGIFPHLNEIVLRMVHTILRFLVLKTFVDCWTRTWYD